MDHTREDWIIIDQLADIILDNVEGCIVEIGTGISTIILLEHAQKNKRDLYSCDINDKKCKWAKKIGVHNVFHGTSFDFMKSFQEDKVALLLVDGDHKYPTVIEEINFFLPRISWGGIMFMHDTMKQTWNQVYLKTGTSDSYLVRQELEARKDLMVFTWPYTAVNFGLTMVMKKEINVPLFRR